MSLSTQISRHFRGFHFGPNSTGVNLKDVLANVTWQQATTQAHSFNTIAALVFHINYYIGVMLDVLEGGPLDAHDKYSFDMPPIKSPQDWQRLLSKLWSDAERVADLIEQMPEAKLWEDFADSKYGSYYKNIHGTIEHSHYHLGQIVIIKKILSLTDK